MKSIDKIISLILISVIAMSCGNGEGSKEGKPESEEEAQATFKLEEKDYYAPAEKEAQQVLYSFITEDLDLLKDHASGMMRMALDEETIKSPPNKERVMNWSGAIKEVRYQHKVITFEDVYYAYALFAGDPQSDEHVYTVALESSDKESWTLAPSYIQRMSGEDYLEKSSELK